MFFFSSDRWRNRESTSFRLHTLTVTHPDSWAQPPVPTSFSHFWASFSSAPGRGWTERSLRNFPGAEVKDSRDSERTRNSQEPQRGTATPPAQGPAPGSHRNGRQESLAARDPQREIVKPVILSLTATLLDLSKIMFICLGAHLSRCDSLGS